MADLEQSLEELEVVKQTFKSNFNASDVSTTNVEFRNYPNLMSQLEKKLPIQNKSISPTTSAQSVSADAGYKLGSVEVGAVVPSDYYKPEESVTIQPMTIEQNITPSSGSVFNGVKVNAVTSAIDSNIQAGNIKEGVSILGVTGTHKGESGGGEGTTTIDGYIVRVVDYDGTILKEDVLQTGDTFTLPSLPTNHERLVAQGWSSPVDIVNNQVTVTNSDIIIGVMYNTISGLSEFDIELTENTGLTVNITGSGTIDWGDGSTDTTTSHTYTNYGNYTITYSGQWIKSGSSSSGFFKSTSTSPNYYCKNVRLGASSKYIGNYAFDSCYSLETITISNSITQFGAYAFQNCYSLKTATVPNTITSIGDQTFQNCYSLENVALPKGIQYIYKNVFYNCNSLEYISIPNSVISLGTNVCNACRSLKHITLPSSITTLASTTSAFANCVSLTRVNMNVTRIGNNCFEYCYSLKDITLPEGLTNIGGYAFRGCYALSNVYIPNSVTSIGDYAFQNCYLLSNVTIPDGVTKLGVSVFYGCYALKGVTMSDNITSIGGNALYTCYSLTKVDIPSNVTTIGTNAFYNCFSILEYDFSKCTVVPTLSGTNAFTGINKLAKIIVPYSLYDEWIATTNWSNFANYIVPTEAIPSTINVTVNNYLGELVSGASVTITGNGNTYTGTTDENGVFTQRDLQPATYTISVADLEGFKTPESVEVVVEEGITNDVSITYLEVPAGFAGLTPSQISQISSQISANNMTSADIETTYGLKTGDTTSFTLSTGENVEIRIIGFNHDDLADGSDKAGITLEMTHCLKTTTLTGASSNSDTGGYVDSKINTTTLPNIFNTIPDDWRTKIRKVSKKVYNGSEIVSYDTDLFLLSVPELNGVTSMTKGGTEEGTIYAYWDGKDSSKRIKNIDTNNDGIVDTENQWWLRSIHNFGGFCFVQTTGGVEHSQTYNTYARAISFAFCI